MLNTISAAYKCIIDFVHLIIIWAVSIKFCSVIAPICCVPIFTEHAKTYEEYRIKQHYGCVDFKIRVKHYLSVILKAAYMGAQGF